MWPSAEGRKNICMQWHHISRTSQRIDLIGLGDDSLNRVYKDKLPGWLVLIIEGPKGGLKSSKMKSKIESIFWFVFWCIWDRFWVPFWDPKGYQNHIKNGSYFGPFNRRPPTAGNGSGHRFCCRFRWRCRCRCRCCIQIIDKGVICLYIHLCTYISIHTYIYSQTSTQTQLNMHNHVHTHLHIQIVTKTSAYTCQTLSTMCFQTSLISGPTPSSPPLC